MAVPRAGTPRPAVAVFKPLNASSPMTGKKDIDKPVENTTDAKPDEVQGEGNYDAARRYNKATREHGAPDR